jgi:hypothetical protein
MVRPQEVHDCTVSQCILAGGLNRCAAETVPVMIVGFVVVLLIVVVVTPGGEFEDDGVR